MYDVVFKLCIFGDGGVGKTTLTQRYVTGLFDGGTRMTIGSDFHIKKVDVDGTKVMLQIWDFAGERQFRFLLPTYIKGASGGIFMYDITRFSTLKNLNEWMEVLEKGLMPGQKLPLILVGGKADLDDRRAVPKNPMEILPPDFNFVGHTECSSKTGNNVEEVFTTITRVMMENSTFK